MRHLNHSLITFFKLLLPIKKRNTPQRKKKDPWINHAWAAFCDSYLCSFQSLWPDQQNYSFLEELLPTSRTDSYTFLRLKLLLQNVLMASDARHTAWNVGSSDQISLNLLLLPAQVSALSLAYSPAASAALTEPWSVTAQQNLFCSQQGSQTNF